MLVFCAQTLQSGGRLGLIVPILSQKVTQASQKNKTYVREGSLGLRHDLLQEMNERTENSGSFVGH